MSYSKKKKYALLLIILISTLSGIELYVQSDAFSLMIRPYVVVPLKEMLGEEVRIGRVKARFLPPSLEVRDLSFQGRNGDEIAAIRRITAYLNPVPLILKKVRIPSITILEPRVFAVRSQDGSINLQPLAERLRQGFAVKQPTGADTDGYHLLLRSIIIKKGRIVFQDDSTPANLSLADLSMIVSVDVSQERVTTSLQEGRLSISAPAYPELTGNLKAKVRYDHGRIHMETFELSTADAMIQVAGEAGFEQHAPLDLSIQVQSGPQVLGKFLDRLNPQKKRKASRVELQAHIGGRVSDPDIGGNLVISALPYQGYLLQNAAVSFSFQNRNLILTGSNWKLSHGGDHLAIEHIAASLGYSRGGVDIERFQVQAGDMTVRFEGRADPSIGYDVNVSAISVGKGRALQFLTGVPVEGEVSALGHLSGLLTGPRMEGTLGSSLVKVRGIPFSRVYGSFEYVDRKLRLSSVEIAEQTSRYVFDGSVDLSGEEPVYAAKLRVLRSDVVNIVALFYEQLPLRLSASGVLNFDGTAKKYSGSGFLRLDAGSAYGESFASGSIIASLTTGKIAFPQVVLYKEKGRVKGTGWIGYDEGTYSAELEADGMDLSTIDRLKGMPIAGPGRLDIHSSGTFARPEMRLNLDVDDLQFNQISFGEVHASAAIRDEVMTIKARVIDERAVFNLRWLLARPFTWQVDASIQNSVFDPFLLSGIKGMADQVRMAVDGSLQVRGQGFDSKKVSGDIHIAKIHAVYGDYRMENATEAIIAINDGKLNAEALSFVGPGTRIDITGWLRPLEDIDLELKGVADVALLKLLYREVEHAAGHAELKISLRDAWKSPDLSGELHLMNGEVKVRDIPQRFTALKGRIIFSEGRLVTDLLSGEMGGGALTASGWAQLKGFSMQEFSAKASVENMTVRYPEGLISTLSGELYYDGDAMEQTLSGDIAIKRARYDKRVEWKSMLVDIGRGLYQKRKTEIGWIGDTQINLRFHGADGVAFQNNLAKMNLDVDVFLKGTVNAPYLLGRIEARKGVVYFRKNDFKILHASADFVDPGRMNPVLDIQAETQVREYLIRLAVTGTSERAIVTLISDPSLNEPDILGLLALGKKGSELIGKEAGVGVGEAASFATGQFQDIFERRARSLTGLDRFQVDPYVGKSDTSVPRVTVGKELVQNKLYVTYSSNVGASVPEQNFRIEYILNRHFSLVGEHNEVGNNGADIKYRFEFK